MFAVSNSSRDELLVFTAVYERSVLKRRAIRDANHSHDRLIEDESSDYYLCY